MSANNGVIRIGRKGIKKFAFGDEGAPGSEPFEVDVVITFHEWLVVDDGFRPIEQDAEGNRPIPRVEIPAYDCAAIEFVESRRGGNKHHPEYVRVSAGEARDFMARLREEYDRLANFFQAKSSDEPESPDTSEVALQFSEEPAA